MSAARSIVPLALSLFILLIPAADGTPFQDNCTKIVQIPLAVNIINSAAKPDGNPVNSDYIRDFVKSMNSTTCLSVNLIHAFENQQSFNNRKP